MSKENLVLQRSVSEVDLRDLPKRFTELLKDLGIKMLVINSAFLIEPSEGRPTLRLKYFFDELIENFAQNGMNIAFFMPNTQKGPLRKELCENIAFNEKGLFKPGIENIYSCNHAAFEADDESQETAANFKHELLKEYFKENYQGKIFLFDSFKCIKILNKLDPNLLSKDNFKLMGENFCPFDERFCQNILNKPKAEVKKPWIKFNLFGCNNNHEH